METLSKFRQLRFIQASYDQQVLWLKYSNDQFAKIFYSWNLKYPILPWQFLTTKKSIGRDFLQAQYGRRMRCRVELTVFGDRHFEWSQLHMVVAVTYPW